MKEWTSKCFKDCLLVRKLLVKDPFQQGRNSNKIASCLKCFKDSLLVPKLLPDNEWQQDKNKFLKSQPKYVKSKECMLF